jgi:hypothetical protein
MDQDDVFSQLAWIEADQNPFHMRVLDCRPFSTTMLSVTQDPNIAARFNHLRRSSGEEHRSQKPQDAVLTACELSYPFHGETKDGPLFVARQMEDKWDIYLYDGFLYFARSWTGELVFRAAIVLKAGEAVITAVEASQARVKDDPSLPVRMVDFLMKSHLYHKEAPHPFPQGFPEDKQGLAPNGIRAVFC